MPRTRTRNRPNAIERVSISLPRTLLESFDAAFVADRESRSAALRRLIEDALWEAQDRADVLEWIEAYRREPQTSEEALVYNDFSDSPWE